MERREEHPILELYVVEEHQQQEPEEREERVDEMPAELQQLFGLADEQAPGVIESWVENVRARYQLRQRQRTLQEQAQLYQLQAESDLQQAKALEARTELIAKRIALGLISPRSRAYLKRHLPELWEHAQAEAELIRLKKDVRREVLKTRVAVERAKRAKYERAADFSKMGYYFAQWQDLIDRVRSDLRGSAQGLTLLLKELKHILAQINQDPELTQEEKKFLRQKLEQEFRNLSATWGRR